jgi:uncharacterized protein YbjT (DUF2867 family)/predicted enzyme related to lactoylglutathione lyase
MFIVAGVSGKVGSVVANELLAKKQPTKVIVRDANKGAEWSKRGAEVAVGSLEDASFLTTALKNATGFFTLLPPNFMAPDFYAYQRKVADAIGQAVKASGVRHVVMLSSVGADLESGNGPIRGLHYLEKVLRGTGVTLTAIRAGYFQENIENSLTPARQMGMYPNFAPSADVPMSMVATKDIGALAAQQLMAKPTKPEVIDLHGPQYTIRQVAEKLGSALGKKLNIVDIPEAGHVEAMMKSGFPKHVAQVFAEMYKGFASGTIRPKGDRLVQGTTALDETIRKVVGSGASTEQHLVHWFEIPTKDLKRAQTFYQHTFEVQLSLHEMGPLKMAWFPMSMGAAGSAGTLVQGETYEPSHKGTLVYFTVQDIDRTLARAKEKGGKVITQKMSIGEHGFVAHFEDSEGNRVGLHAMN